MTKSLKLSCFFLLWKNNVDIRWLNSLVLNKDFFVQGEYRDRFNMFWWRSRDLVLKHLCDEEIICLFKNKVLSLGNHKSHIWSHTALKWQHCIVYSPCISFHVYIKSLLCIYCIFLIKNTSRILDKNNLKAWYVGSLNKSHYHIIFK